MTGAAGRIKISYQDLIDEHEQIDVLAQRLEEIALVDDGDHTQAEDTLALLAEAVASHLRKEDSVIYPDLVAATDPGGASALAVEFEILKADWNRYLAAWGQGIAQADWHQFQRDSFGILRRLRQRVMRETSLLYGMALREGVITLRRDATGG